MHLGHPHCTSTAWRPRREVFGLCKRGSNGPCTWEENSEKTAVSVLVVFCLGGVAHWLIAQLVLRRSAQVGTVPSLLVSADCIVSTRAAARCCGLPPRPAFRPVRTGAVHS